MEKYDDAAIRHYKDADALKNANQFDNAGHLIGFSAECAIKYCIRRTHPESPKVHFPALLLAARKYFNYRSSMFNVLKGDLLKGWIVDHRYYATGRTVRAELDEWVKDTQRLLAAAGIKGR